LLSYEVAVIRATASVPFASVNVIGQPALRDRVHALFAAVSMAPRIVRGLHLHDDLRSCRCGLRFSWFRHPLLGSYGDHCPMVIARSICSWEDARRC
jgi:hypothetical protein